MGDSAASIELSVRQRDDHEKTKRRTVPWRSIRAVEEAPEGCVVLWGSLSPPYMHMECSDDYEAVKRSFDEWLERDEASSFRSNDT